MSRQGASLEELEDRLVKAKQQHDAASLGIKALQTLNKVEICALTQKNRNLTDAKKILSKATGTLLD